ncbi:unnamed protein product, partial [Scytosiphon promiscuus]
MHRLTMKYCRFRQKHSSSLRRLLTPLTAWTTAVCRNKNRTREMRTRTPETDTASNPILRCASILISCLQSLRNTSPLLPFPFFSPRDVYNLFIQRNGLLPAREGPRNRVTSRVIALPSQANRPIGVQKTPALSYAWQAHCEFIRTIRAPSGLAYEELVPTRTRHSRVDKRICGARYHESVVDASLTPLSPRTVSPPPPSILYTHITHNKREHRPLGLGLSRLSAADAAYHTLPLPPPP